MFFIPLLNSAIPTPQHPREHNIYSYLGVCYIHLFIHLKGCAFVVLLSLCQQYKVRLADTIGWMLKVTAEWRSDSCWHCTNISAIEGKKRKSFSWNLVQTAENQDKKPKSPSLTVKNVKEHQQRLREGFFFFIGAACCWCREPDRGIWSAEELVAAKEDSR